MIAIPITTGIVQSFVYRVPCGYQLHVNYRVIFSVKLKNCATRRMFIDELVKVTQVFTAEYRLKARRTFRELVTAHLFKQRFNAVSL